MVLARDTEVLVYRDVVVAAGGGVDGVVGVADEAGGPLEVDVFDRLAGFLVHDVGERWRGRRDVGDGVVFTYGSVCEEEGEVEDLREGVGYVFWGHGQLAVARDVERNVEEVTTHGREWLGLVFVCQFVFLFCLLCRWWDLRLTASMIPRPGVKMRPLTMLKALVSGWPLFCRATTWCPFTLPLPFPFPHCPSICASLPSHVIHNTISERRNPGSPIIAQQRRYTSLLVASEEPGRARMQVGELRARIRQSQRQEDCVQYATDFHPLSHCACMCMMQPGDG